MDLVTLLVGVTLLAVVLVDLCWTLLWVTGSSGPLNGRLIALIWPLGRRLARGDHRVLSLFGPVSLLVSMFAWSGLLWLGWALIFAADPTSVRTSTGVVVSDLAGQLYLTGTAIFTMGIGDLQPTPDWRLPTVLANASGLLFLTLVVSYLLTIVSAVVSLRSLAASLAAVGSSPSDMAGAVARAGSVAGFERILEAAGRDLTRSTEQLSAYPALRFFHASSPERSAPRMAATLYDALIMLDASSDERSRPDGLLVRTTRAAIRDHLASRAPGRTDGADPPRPPDFEGLEADGLDIDRARLAETLERLEDERAQLAAALAELGWPWPSR